MNIEGGRPTRRTSAPPLSAMIMPGLSGLSEPAPLAAESLQVIVTGIPPAGPATLESSVAPGSPGESVARMHIKASAGALVVDSTQ